MQVRMRFVSRWNLSWNAGKIAGSNNKWVELYNPGTSTLSMTGFSVLTYMNGHSDEPHNTFDLSGFSIPAGGTFLICHSHAKLPGSHQSSDLRSINHCQ